MWVLGMKKNSLFILTFIAMCFIGINSIKAADCSTLACATCNYKTINNETVSYDIKSDGSSLQINTTVSGIATKVESNIPEGYFTSSSGTITCPVVYITVGGADNYRSTLFTVNSSQQANESAVSPSRNSTNNQKKITVVDTQNYTLSACDQKCTPIKDSTGYKSCVSTCESCRTTSCGSIPSQYDKTKCEQSQCTQGYVDKNVNTTTDDDDQSGSTIDGAVGCAVLPDELIDFLQTVLDYIRIIGIALAVILGIVDYIKAAFGSDEKTMATANKHFSSRVIAVALLFLIPSILSLLLKLFNIYTDASGATCGVN